MRSIDISTCDDIVSITPSIAIIFAFFTIKEQTRFSILLATSTILSYMEILKIVIFKNDTFFAISQGTTTNSVIQFRFYAV